MHELAICQSLLREAERVARENGADHIAGLSVVIGPLSGVEGALLERAFGVARVGTLAEAAALHLEEAPVVVWCGACDQASTVPANALRCDACGDWRVNLRSGDELILKQVELRSQAARH